MLMDMYAVYVCLPWPLGTCVSALQIVAFVVRDIENERLYPETQRFQPRHMTPAVTNQRPATDNCALESMSGCRRPVFDLNLN